MEQRIDTPSRSSPITGEQMTSGLATASSMVLMFVYLPLTMMTWDLYDSYPGLVGFVRGLAILTIVCLIVAWGGIRRWPNSWILGVVATLPLIVFVFLVLAFLFG